MKTSTLVFLVAFVVPWTTASKNIGQVIDSIFSTYDKRVRPPTDPGKPVEVGVETAILDVYGFDEIKHEVTMTIYLRQKWVDSRLQFNPNEVNQLQTIALNPEQGNKLWIPDTFIANERRVVKHEFTTPNEFTRVTFNGSIARSMKLTVTVGCIMYLRWFPFDQNVCSMDFESYGYAHPDIRYTWNKNDEGIPKIWISKEASQSIRHTITAFQGKDYELKLSTGTYSRVGLQLNFKRLSFRYILDVYFPSTAIPVVAFITLVVGSLHFRVLMSTICMGIMVVYAAILMLLTPKVDYKTALDFYVFNSSVTVFNVVLVNFFMYNVLKPKASPSQIRMRQINGTSTDNDEGKEILVDEESGEGTVQEAPAAPRFPNKSSELLYKFCEKSYLTMPIFFIIFNLIYWPVVLIASSGTPENFIPLESRDV